MKKIIVMMLVVMLVTSSSIAGEYVLGPYDTLEINILDHSELKAKATITPDGQISLPLIGFVKVSSLSLQSLEAVLKAKYMAYIKDPSITIDLTPKPIYVIQHDLKKNVWDVKAAKSIDEANAFMGSGESYSVNVGKQPDWWEDNWTKVVSATAVIVGIVNVTRKW